MKLKRRSYGFSLVPASSYARPYNCGASSVLQAPVGNTFSFTIYGHKSIARHISSLCFLSSPPAVFGRIAFIIINAVQRVLGRRLISHICKKIRKSFERVIPSLANLYSSPTVPFISSVISIIAATTHISPRIINRPFIAHRPTMSVPLVSSAFSVVSKITHTHRRYFTLDCPETQRTLCIGRPMTS